MNTNYAYQDASMSDRDFRRFSTLIYEQSGINLVPEKKTMLTGRLRKRLRDLSMDSFGEYYAFVSSGQGQANEMVRMINVVSTNKTEFFRESKHFDMLKKIVLPDLIETGKWRPGRSLNVWSAGCSTGQEPYTIAMVLSEYAADNRSGDFSILASDISTRVLDTAAKGIYPVSTVAPVASDLRRKYFMRGKTGREGFCRIVPELRRCVQFRRINLNEGNDFGIRKQLDVIFCRNVIIYFDRETQRKLFKKFYDQLAPGGYLFIGHSETLHGVNDQFKVVGSATYVKPHES